VYVQQQKEIKKVFMVKNPFVDQNKYSKLTPIGSDSDLILSKVDGPQLNHDAIYNTNHKRNVSI
jgi:hypothetical protein